MVTQDDRFVTQRGKKKVICEYLLAFNHELDLMTHWPTITAPVRTLAEELDLVCHLMPKKDGDMKEMRACRFYSSHLK